MILRFAAVLAFIVLLLSSCSGSGGSNSDETPGAGTWESAAWDHATWGP